MKISGFGPQMPGFTGDKQGIPARLMGLLALSEDGELILKTQSGEAFPVRLIGADLPLGREINFRVIGNDGNSLILSSPDSFHAVDRWESLLKDMGLPNDKSWRELSRDLFRENIPITKDNLLGLERNLRIVRQEMGFEIKPRVLAFMMGKGIPVRPQTILAVLYRLYPEMRQRIASALEECRPAEIMLGSAETIERSLQEVLNQPKAVNENGMVWQAALGSVVYKAGDDGEIHWPSQEPDEEEHDSDYGKRFGFELLPPRLGLVEVRVNWSQEASRISFIVDPKVVEGFREAIPAWVAELQEKGFQIVANVQAAAEESAEPPPGVDRRI